MTDPRVQELWADVLGRWKEEDVHAAFVEYCRASRQLDQAAKLYRRETQASSAYRDDPTHFEIARKRLQGIATLAMFEIDAARATHRETVRSEAARAFNKLGCFAIFMVILVVAGLSLMRKGFNWP
jgi:hypothetical protein